jgi:hypothetical protein
MSPNSESEWGPYWILQPPRSTAQTHNYERNLTRKLTFLNKVITRSGAPLLNCQNCKTVVTVAPLTRYDARRCSIVKSVKLSSLLPPCSLKSDNCLRRAAARLSKIKKLSSILPPSSFTSGSNIRRAAARLSKMQNCRRFYPFEASNMATVSRAPLLCCPK